MAANWVNTSARSPAAVISSRISSSRASFPDRAASSRDPSARKWAGWLQTCLSFIIEPEMTPIRSIPSWPARSGRACRRPRPGKRLACSGEVAQHVHLDLLRQVGDDRAVGLEAPEHERPVRRCRVAAAASSP